MTEDKAKTKWCPAIRLTIREDGNYKDTWAQTNRGEDISCGASTNCLASACMAWRSVGQIGIGPGGERRDLDLDGLTKWIDDGYCGLAGAPR